jgi:glycosyltransferase involved in cell wall biosynthesis
MIKVIQVVEVAGPAAQQAAAVRKGLDPAKFEVSAVGDSSQLRRLFAERRPDVVHAYSFGLPARTAAKSAGVKKIFCGPRADESSTRGVLDRLIGRFAPPAVVVRDAYLGGFPEAKPHEGLLVGSLGEMTPAHNSDAWVLLAQRLCDSRNGLSCLWIGGGEEEPAARVNLTNMNLLSKVEVTGLLPEDAARERLRGLDLFVHYTLAGAPSAPILDAMAAGLPVVASDLPAHREAVEDGVTGYLVKNEVELLERCQALLDDDALRLRLGAAGRERLRREFSLDKRLAELSRLYSA